MTGGVFTSWPSTLVFFRLMVSLKSLQAWENMSIRHCRSCSVREVTAASSAKNMSLMMVSHTLVFALSLVILYSLPSDLPCMFTPSVEFLKVCFRRGRRGCWRELEQERSLASRRLWLDGCLHTIMKRSDHAVKLRGHPIFKRMLKSLFRLTRSKASIRCMKAM